MLKDLQATTSVFLVDDFDGKFCGIHSIHGLAFDLVRVYGNDCVVDKNTAGPVGPRGLGQGDTAFISETAVS